MSFYGLHGSQACTWHTDLHAGKVFIYIKLKENKKKYFRVEFMGHLIIPYITIEKTYNAIQSK